MKLNSFDITWMPNCLREVSSFAKSLPTTLLRDQFAEFLKNVDLHLTTHPKDWGDPRYNLFGMNVVQYARTFIVDGLIVRYAVHTVKPYVFVNGIDVIENGPFDIS